MPCLHETTVGRLAGIVRQSLAAGAGEPMVELTHATVYQRRCERCGAEWESTDEWLHAVRVALDERTPELAPLGDAHRVRLAYGGD